MNMAYWRRCSDWEDDDPWGCEEEEEDEIEFYRPDGHTENKSKVWCRSNGFYEIQEGLWSGDWYWKHFPEKKRELEEEREAKKRELEEKQKVREEELKDPQYWEKWNAEQRQRRRAELLDEVYDSFPPYNERALAELRRLDEGEHNFECPVPGCNRRFPTNDATQEHVREQTGKGHDRYRSENGIPFEGFDKKKVQKRLAEIERESWLSDLDFGARQEYDLGPDRILEQDKHLFDVPLADRLEEEPFNLQCWLDSVRMAREKAKAWDESAYVSERLFMRKWLNRQRQSQKA